MSAPEPTSDVACPAAGCESEPDQPCREWTGALTWRPRRVLHRERIALAKQKRNQHNLPIDSDGNCVCREEAHPHAQHVPLTVVDRAIEYIDKLADSLPESSPLRLFLKVDVHNFILAGTRVPVTIEPTLMMLRARGWMVAVHNDYRQNGKLMTFWLFTRHMLAVKGEGETDAEALAQVMKQVEGR